MTKNEFMQRLKKALENVPKEESEKLLEYYRELIDDGVESGKSEEAVVGELESPETVAYNYRKESGISEEEKPQPSHEKKEKPKKDEDVATTLVKVLAAIFGVFVAFVGAIILFSFGVSGFSIAASGFVVFFSAFALILEPLEMIAQMGTGLILLAVGILFLIGTSLLGRLYALLLRALFFLPKNGKEVKFKKTIASLIACGCVFVLGIALFVAGAGAIGFKYGEIFDSENIIMRTEEITESFDNLKFESDDLALEVTYSEDETTKIEWHEYSGDEWKYTYSDGHITLKSPYTGWRNVTRIWKRGILFSIFSASDKLAHGTLYLPASYTGSLEIELKNGAIEISEMSFAGLDLSSANGAIKLTNIQADTLTADTHNGAIKVTGGEFKSLVASTNNGTVNLIDLTAENISAETSNGAVKLEELTATKIKARTNNGSIGVENILAEDIDLGTDNGSVRGTISGRKEDYRIDVRTGNGKSNLTNTTTGDKILVVRTGNGSVNLTFAD